jgi:4-hydroxythreonine-4-phosphate dehydrogenase
MVRDSRPLVLTPGDPDGIGPEVTWKAIRRLARQPRSRAGSILCVGARAPFKKLKAPVIETSLEELQSSGFQTPRRKAPFIWLLPAPEGKPGFQAGWSIQQATRWVLSQQARALVTGPIHKERLQEGGFKYSGHTDFLADLCAVRDVTMMLANDLLRVSLVTIHVGLGRVPSEVTASEIRRAVDQTVASLRDWWGIRRPRIAISALNPHAGENGLFGREEIEVIAPEINALRHRYGSQVSIFGPLPADTLFAKHVEMPKKQRFDAVICMYHDQGLIPVKLLDFHRTVNVTLGLPIVRTSVDHGVGFDIAGKNVANPSSMESAIRLALELTSN